MTNAVWRKNTSQKIILWRRTDTERIEIELPGNHSDQAILVAFKRTMEIDRHILGFNSMTIETSTRESVGE